MKKMIKKNSVIKDNNGNFNLLYKDLKNEPNKNKQNQKGYNRPSTVMNIKKNEQNSLKQNNIELVTNNEIFNNNQNKKIYTQKENKKVGNMDYKPVSVNIYNATINSFE